MDRKIKFRGKRVDNGEYVYGDYLTPWEGRAKYPQIRVTRGDHKDENGHITAECYPYEVYADSVKQFVEEDSTGEELYEGDKGLDVNGKEYIAQLRPMVVRQTNLGEDIHFNPKLFKKVTA